MTQANSNKTWSAHAEDADADTSQSLGSYFQRERQKKQQTIQEVAEATCIAQENLKALEAGDRNRLPVAVFTKGFVKIYAAHLGLNQAEIQERFNSEWGAVASTTPEILSGESMAESSPFFLSFRFYLLLFVIALLMGLAYFFFQADAPPSPTALTTVSPAAEPRDQQLIVKKVALKQAEKISTAPSQETLLISPQSAGKIAMEEDQSRHDVPRDQAGTEGDNHSQIKAATVSPDSPIKADHAHKTTSPGAASHPAPSPVSHNNSAPEIDQPPPSILQSVNLHIRFLKKTRIAIAQDDGQLEKYIFAPGEESSWQAASHITLHVDTADAVELTLNGSPITVEDSIGGPLAITLPSDITR